MTTTSERSQFLFKKPKQTRYRKSFQVGMRVTAKIPAQHVDFIVCKITEEGSEIGKWNRQPTTEQWGARHVERKQENNRISKKYH